MAGKKNEMLTAVLYVGGAYFAYKIAAGGGFGPGAQSFVKGLGATLKGTVGTVLPGAGGTAPPSGSPGVTPGIPPQPGFDANNFVGASNGGWVVYVGGINIGFFTDLGTAERAYNAARGFPN